MEVFDLEINELKKLPANSSYFCVMRLWDQWTESVMLKGNEDNYQKQLEVMRNAGGLTNPDHIMAYYVLLCVRILVANKERPHYPSVFSSISQESDQSELEDNELEMDGPIHLIKSTIDPSSQHLARQVVKMVMNQTFIKWCEILKGQKWELYQTHGESFILSDALCGNFAKGYHVLPINPQQALIAESTHEKLVKDGVLSVAFINELMTSNAVNYYIKAPKSDIAAS